MRRNEVLSRPAAAGVALRFLASVLRRRLLQSGRYPRLRLAPWHRGLAWTLWTLARLRLTKVVRAGGGFHFSIFEPRWPSPAYDRLMARGGLSLAAAGTAGKDQIDYAILAVSRACPHRCFHCYEHANLGGPAVVSVARWAEVVAGLQAAGLGVAVLSGGEPFARFEDTLALVRVIDTRLSDVHVHTSGHGVTRERLRALAAAGLVAVGVGLDDVEPARHDRSRGTPGAFAEALEAIRTSLAEGLFTYVNTCVSPSLVPRLDRFYALTAELGVGALQLLEPKPCGRLAGAGPNDFLDEAEAAGLRRFVASTTRGRYRSWPPVFHPGTLEAPENLGCTMGGLVHLYIDAVGNVEPCVFLPVAFGNVLEEDVRDVLRRMRVAVPRPMHVPCPAVQLARRVGFERRAGRPLPLRYADVASAWASTLAPPPRR